MPQEDFDTDFRTCKGYEKECGRYVAVREWRNNGYLCSGCRRTKTINENFKYHSTGGANGPTGHGDTCMSDADSGL